MLVGFVAGVLIYQLAQWAFTPAEGPPKPWKAQNEALTAAEPEMLYSDPCDIPSVLCPVSEPIQATVTAYSLPGTMANGETVHDGAMACPKSVPFGTIYQIEGLGTYTCKDRTASGRDGLFDIWVATTDEAVRHGAPVMKLTELE